MCLGPPVFDLRRLFERHRPDIFQLCDVSGNTIRFSDIPELPVPVVHRMSDFWPYHGAHHYAEEAPSPPDIADRLLRRFVFDGRCMPDRRIAPSHWLADRLDGGMVEVIRNAVRIPENAVTRKLKSGVVRLGFISGQLMDPRKGLATLPPLFANAGRKMPQVVELHIYGRVARGVMPTFENVKIVHHPPYYPSELPGVFGTFDILLCPSRRDNSPNVVTEALSYGVPVIGQRGTGIDSYLNDETGILVNFHGEIESSAAALFEAVHNIVVDYAEFSSAAQAYARNELHPRVIGARYLELYEKLSNGDVIV
jgi:glycosyltransferase involved in cell wall biosynthesis